MTWSGFVALGTVASNVFTESSATGYARVAFNFNNQINGRLQGYGPNVTFTASSANVTTYNAWAFYTGSSGGDAILIYPTLNTYTYGSTASYVLNPYVVNINAIDGVTHEGMSLDFGDIRTISGLNPIEQTFSAVSGLTAHAGGGQGSAVNLTGATINRVSTVATAGDSVALPLANAGSMITIINTGANPVGVFPASGDSINGLSANASVTQQPSCVANYWCAAAGAWHVELGTGYSGSLPTVSYTNGITAHAGGGQASAVALTTVLNRITTVGTAADSVALPTAVPGLEITVTNAAAANSMNIFPVNGGSDAINALSANAAYALAATKTATFYCTVAAQWHTLLTA